MVVIFMVMHAFGTLHLDLHPVVVLVPHAPEVLAVAAGTASPHEPAHQ